jgi:hypothetical protein
MYWNANAALCITQTVVRVTIEGIPIGPALPEKPANIRRKSGADRNGEKTPIRSKPRFIESN